MTATALNPATSIASAPQLRAAVASAILLLAVIAVLVVLVVSRTSGSSARTTTGGHSNLDNSYCRPTSVVHYC